MRPVLLIDFGSTYTKVTAVDTESETLLGTAASFTTIQTDINDGLNNALALLEEKTGKLDFAARYACSSAAGGLRMIASGLVPELTAEAAKQAALGAGAKIAKIYSYDLTEDDVEEIDAIKPDIFLLVGGTDGGNIVIGKQDFNEVEKRFKAMGFDRAFGPGTAPETTIAALKEDLKVEA